VRTDVPTHPESNSDSTLLPKGEAVPAERQVVALGIGVDAVTENRAPCIM